MKTNNHILLSAMMFLQFFVWGAWYVVAPLYLSTIGFQAKEIKWTFSVGPIAGMISPFFIGMIADRFFPAQKVLGVMHLLGGLFMILATTLMKSASPSPNWIILAFFGHMLAYYPTLALSATLAMRNMKSPDKEFPIVRAFGTIGWIVAGVFVSIMQWDASIEMFYLSAAAAFVLGIFSFFLPHTPPIKKGEVSIRQIIGMDALVLLKDRSYLIFIVSSFLICIPLAFYYQIASRVVEMSFANEALTMSYGQMMEILFMILMPFFLLRLGVKWMLGVGMLAWVLRYVLFAFGAPDQIAWMILSGVLLHGICYDFFFLTGQIYTERVAPRQILGQAQGMLALFTLGLGLFIGAQVAGKIEAMHTTDESKSFASKVVELSAQIETLTKQANESRDDSLFARISTLEDEKKKARQSELRAIEWKPLWAKPAAIAAIVMVLFLLKFKEKSQSQNPNSQTQAS